MLPDLSYRSAAAAQALADDGVAAAAYASPPEMPADLYGYLSSAVASAGSETAGFAWAFEGIAFFLGQAATRADNQRQFGPALEALGAWLARPPIPVGASLSMTDARDELTIFGERIFTRLPAREQFAQHLLARWPLATVPDLRSLLSELQYLAADTDSTD